MDRIRLAAIECNYKEIDRKLKEQFMYRINDSDMLAEIFRQFTKTYENTHVTREQELAQVKRIEVQRVKAMVIHILS